VLRRWVVRVRRGALQVQLRAGAGCHCHERRQKETVGEASQALTSVELG
jgi:hypothetical protein